MFLEKVRSWRSLYKHSATGMTMILSQKSPTGVTEIPDPEGKRLAAVRQAILEHPHIEAIFWDFGSLYQVRPPDLAPMASLAACRPPSRFALRRMQGARGEARSRTLPLNEH